MRYSRQTTSRLTAAVGGFALMTLAGATPGHAGGAVFPPVKDPIVAAECSACHMLYPAGLLPAASWNAIVDGLVNHFGSNAEMLDAATATHVRDYLVANAGESGAAATAPLKAGALPKPVLLRITETEAFKGDHPPRRLTAARLKRKNAKSPSDCKACHRKAETGDFD